MSANPMWKRPWVDVEAEVGRRVNEHRRDKARRERLKLLADRALALALVGWAAGGLMLTPGWRLTVGLVLIGCATTAGLVAACLRAAAALPREPRGAVLEGPGRRGRRGAA